MREGGGRGIGGKKVGNEGWGGDIILSVNHIILK